MTNTKEKQVIESGRLAKNSLLLYVRMIIVTLISLYTSRILLRELGVTDFGLYNVIAGFVVLVGFAQQALSNATWRFVTVSVGEGNLEKTKLIFNTAIILHIILCIIVLIICESVGLYLLNNYMQIPQGRMDDAFWVFQISIATTLLMIMSSPYDSLIIAHERMDALAYISILDITLKCIVACSLVFFELDRIVIYSLFLLVVQFIVRFIYWLFCRLNFEECRLSLVFEKKRLMEMGKFALYSIVSAAGLAASNHGINLLLNIFFGPVVNAARGFSIQVYAVVQKFTQSYLQAVSPQITKLYASNEICGMHVLVCKTAKFSFFIMLITIVPMIAEMNNLLMFWLGDFPKYTAEFCRISLCIAVLDTAAYPFLVGAAANGQIRHYYIITGLLYISIIPIAYYGLSLGVSPVFVYIVQLIMQFVILLWRVIKGARMINLSLKTLFNQILIPILKVILVSVVLLFLLWKMRDFYSHIVMTILFTVSIMVVISIWGIDENEKKYILSKVKSLSMKHFS